MRGLWIRLKSAWRALTSAEALDRSMDEEMRFHIDMEAERLGREQGWTRERRSGARTSRSVASKSARKPAETLADSAGSTRCR